MLTFIPTPDLTSRGTPRIRRRKNKIPCVKVGGYGAPPGWEDVDLGAARAAGAAIQTAYQRALCQGLNSYEIGPLHEIIERSKGRCELTGIKFSSRVIGMPQKRPFIPSVDRIEPREPYTFRNCRLVCWIVNMARNERGDEVFWEMVRAAYEHCQASTGSGQ